MHSYKIMSRRIPQLNPRANLICSSQGCHRPRTDLGIENKMLGLGNVRDAFEFDGGHGRSCFGTFQTCTQTGEVGSGGRRCTVQDRR